MTTKPDRVRTAYAYRYASIQPIATIVQRFIEIYLPAHFLGILLTTRQPTKHGLMQQSASSQTYIEIVDRHACIWPCIATTGGAAAPNLISCPQACTIDVTFTVSIDPLTQSSLN